MSKARKNRYKDLIACWFYGLSILFILWVVSSTFEVWYHNALVFAGKSYDYSTLNFYEIMLEYFWR